MLTNNLSEHVMLQAYKTISRLTFMPVVHPYTFMVDMFSDENLLQFGYWVQTYFVEMLMNSRNQLKKKRRKKKNQEENYKNSQKIDFRRAW